MANIREYENVQLKAAQEENDALLKYKTQIARLEHQYVPFSARPTRANAFLRLKFESAQLDGTRERLQRLRATVERERRNLEDKLESDLEALQGEIAEAEEQVKSLRSDLEDLEKDVAEKNAAVDAARRAYNKASRALDEVSKDVSGWVRVLCCMIRAGG